MNGTDPWMAPAWALWLAVAGFAWTAVHLAVGLASM